MESINGDVTLTGVVIVESLLEVLSFVVEISVSMLVEVPSVVLKVC